MLALKQALEPLGDVYVLAPDTNQSAVGHTKTFMRPLRVRERTLADGGRGWSVDGSPTDAVSLAFLGYFDIGFDLVASGINYGANLGDDITYSGTVSAAMEAVLSACPAFAISQEYYEHPDFTLAAQMAYRAAVNILENGLAPGELININVPAIPPGGVRGVEVTRMGKRIYQDELIERLDPRGTPYYWIGGPPPSGLAEPGTDFDAVVNKRIAVTPIQLDLTARRLLSRLNSWSWTLPGREQESAPAAAPRYDRRRDRIDEVVTAQGRAGGRAPLAGRRLCLGAQAAELLGRAADDQVVAGDQDAIGRRVGLVVLRPVSDGQRVDAALDERADRLAGEHAALADGELFDRERQLAVGKGEVEKVGHARADGDLGDLAAGAACTARRRDRRRPGAAWPPTPRRWPGRR